MLESFISNKSHHSKVYSSIDKPAEDNKMLKSMDNCQCQSVMSGKRRVVSFFPSEIDDDEAYHTPPAAKELTLDIKKNTMEINEAEFFFTSK
jgi:hypothetical protein